MRLGQLLVEAGASTPGELEAALHAQVIWGARLGTALVELGSIDLDTLSNALAAQHHVPAALASHFDRADRSLQLLLSPSHAERFECVPLMRVGKRAIVVASVARLEARAIAILSDELAVDRDRIICAIAPELRIRYALERIYQIARPHLAVAANAQVPAVLRGSALEIVDARGKVRASLAVYPENPGVKWKGKPYPETVLLRLMSPFVLSVTEFSAGSSAP